MTSLRNLAVFRRSAIPYLALLVLGHVLGAYANYLSPLVWPDGLTIRGQSLGVVIPSITFGLAVFAWLIYRGRPVASNWLRIFLFALGISWLIHMTIALVHGDPVPHTVWIYLPTLGMLFLKAPNRSEVKRVLSLLMVTFAVILVITKILEEIEAIPTYFIPEYVREFDESNYWVPLDGILGFEGRWPGPFGYNSKTGIISAFIVVFAVGIRSRLSFLLLPIGVFFLLATDSRIGYLTSAAGLLVLALFAQRSWVRRLHAPTQLLLTVAAVVLAGFVLFRLGPSSTGRLNEGGIWSDYLALWSTSPWIGVGKTGFLSSPELVDPFYDAHSIYVQELAKYGVVGFAIQFAAIGIALVLCLRAAMRGFALPLALVSVYLVGGMTEVIHDGWLSHNFYFDIVILATMLCVCQSNLDQIGKKQNSDDVESSVSIFRSQKSSEDAPRHEKVKGWL